MAESTHWSFPANLQPKADELRFDLASAMRSVVMLRAEIPEDAFTAPILGTERFGNGVVIRDDGLMVTIGYLITEAESIWLTTNDGTVVPGHPLAYDFASGLGLVLPLGQLGVPALPRGSAASIAAGDDAIVIGHGGRQHALEAQVFAKREFAGFWEYVLDEALFTTPPHPEWSGAALVGLDGRLLGIGSLFVQEAVDDKAVQRQPLRAHRPDRADPGRPPVARALVAAAAAVARHVHRRGRRPARRRRRRDRRTRRSRRRAAGRRRRRGRRQARQRAGRTVSQRVAAGSRGNRDCAGTAARRRADARRVHRATATISCASRCCNSAREPAFAMQDYEAWCDVARIVVQVPAAVPPCSSRARACRSSPSALCSRAG